MFGEADLIALGGGTEWMGDFRDELQRLLPGTLIVKTRPRNPKVCMIINRIVYEKLNKHLVYFS